MPASNNPLPQNPDLGDVYQQLYDDLGRAYWETSGAENKDLLHGTQEAIGKILTAINQQDLATNTALFLKLKSSIDAVNVQLEEIRQDINKITRNIETAGKIIAGINQALSLVPKIAGML